MTVSAQSVIQSVGSAVLWGESDQAQRATLRSLPGYHHAARRAKDVAKVSNARGIVDLAGYWTLIAAALTLVGHEAIHYLLLRHRRLNDWAGELPACAGDRSHR
jgi:fatty acid desaturase